MNPFAHFEDQFGHLQLSDNDAALHVFLAGWNSAMMEMMQRVNKMPFGDDTRASFAVYFQSQMINVDAIEKPAQQQDADHDFKNFHRSLCERFNYVHDEKDWKRDLVSLEEWIAKKVQPEQEPVIYNTAWQSPHDDDRWCENPEDWEIIDGFDPPVFVGFEYELTAGRYTKERYRVTKIADDESDDVEVELISLPKPEKNNAS